MRQEALQEQKMAQAGSYDVWALMSVRYCLRALGLRADFYKIAAEDPTYAKMVLPSLKRRREVVAADFLDGPISKLESHMATQLMKEVATLSASNATK